MHVYFQTQTHCISAKHDIVLNIGSKMFEDSKWVRIHKSREKTKTKKKLKRTNNDLQNTTHIIQDNDWSLTSRNVFIFIGDSLPLSLLEVILSSKGAIRIHISKKNRQQNVQKKKYKRTNNDQQNIHIKLKTE
jgi:hypothetical protein